MTAYTRRIALLSMSPDIAENGGLNSFPSYGVRRVQAAVVADPALRDVETVLFDGTRFSAEDFTARVLAFKPDLLGLSAYVWSIEIMTLVAREVKLALPDCTIVVGGPAAHPEVFDLKPYAPFRTFIDAIVLREGEEIFRAIAALPRPVSGESLKKINGIAIPTPFGWFRTNPHTPNPDMDTIASPFQEGLMPERQVAYVETFRGCPLSCSFCQWGIMDAKRRFSREYLVRELTAMKASGALYTFLVDAGLNLNASAFRNLCAAEEEVNFFATTPMLCEVYPSLLRPEHLAFLQRARWAQIGLGVQSLDPNVLNTNSRPFKPHQLRTVIEQLSEFALVDVEIILGLPGDTPETFKRTLDEALTLPCNVRVYKCLILPDGLMTRPPKDADIHFDPRTLLMQSCNTWSEKELRETEDYLTRLAAAMPNCYTGEFWWHFICAIPKYQAACAPLPHRTPARPVGEVAMA